LLDAFNTICEEYPEAQLRIVGGSTESISSYTAQYRDSRVLRQTHFLGPRPIHTLAGLLKNADILVSPRTKGNNTPMKVYSYLHSGTVVLATNLPTHTQVLTDKVSVLAEPNATDFGLALKKLLDNPELRITIGDTAKTTADELYTKEAFEKQLSSLYDLVAKQLGTSQTSKLVVENQ
jgi:glycosyltransferase involved in cell wall biosynthesis